MNLDKVKVGDTIVTFNRYASQQVQREVVIKVSSRNVFTHRCRFAKKTGLENSLSYMTNEEAFPDEASYSEFCDRRFLLKQVELAAIDAKDKPGVSVDDLHRCLAILKGEPA